MGTLVASLPAHAQTPDQGINLQVSSLPITLTTQPGTSVSTDLKIRNIAAKPEKLQVRLLRVTEDDNGVVRLSAPSSADEWAKWVSFSRPVFDAPPGVDQTIKMTVDVPKNAAFGYYFAVEYMRATAENPEAGKAVAKGAVANFILLNADAPGSQREAQIVSFSSDKKFYEFLPVGFQVKIRATGNVHVAPHGNIFISQSGKQVGVIDVNAAGGNILPQSSRFFTASWTDGFPVYMPKTQNGQPVHTKKGEEAKYLKWDFSHANTFRIGHYTAHLVMVYDNGQRDVPIEATVSFWIIPWRMIGITLIPIIIIGFLLYKYLSFRRRYYKKVKNKKE